MRPTRRGAAVLCVAAGGFLFSFAGGPRSLNAVVLPVLVAAVAAAAQVALLDAPVAERDRPADGFVGERHGVELDFRRSDDPGARPFVGSVRERVGDGLSADRTEFEAAVGGEPIRYEVEYVARGEHALGPATVAARDVFGLVEATFDCPGEERLLVYPRVRPVDDAALARLRGESDAERSVERGDFDRLREYERGDPLRSVHWRSTAKRDELVVKEFTVAGDAETVTVAAGADGADGADAMAEAAASLALALLSEGVPVDVALPDGRAEAGPERGGRTRLLELLARTGPGRIPDPDADVVIEARDGEATVRSGRTETTFAALAGSGDPPAAATAGGGSP